ncbi:PAS domain-containing protein [Thermodesulfitimonas sp.]
MLRRWEERTLQLAARFKLVFENTPMVGIASGDQSGRTLFLNKEAKRILGCDPATRDPDWTERFIPAGKFKRLLERSWENGQAVEPLPNGGYQHLRESCGGCSSPFCP